MASRLADRLRAARQRLFVGREAPQQLFRDALAAEVLPFSVLHVHGPGGIGKTALLHACQRLAVEAGVPVHYLDTRAIEATPSAFLTALRDLLEIEADEHPMDVLARAETRCVLLFDTFELMAPLERWLYTSLLPELPDEVLVVLAGRNPLTRAWTTDPGWRALVRSYPLRNLSPEEAGQYLHQCGIPEAQQADVLRFTHGYPLALSLVADTVAQRPGLLFESNSDPDVIKTLLDRFISEVPSPMHRMALEASALVRYLTEPLLVEMIEASDASDLFGWLRSLSFMDAGPRGLFPHDLARDVLSADLRWRNPDQHHRFHQRARAYYSARLQQADASVQLVLTDYIYLHRENPVVRPFFRQLQQHWSEEEEPAVASPYDAGDRTSVVEMIRRHEGVASGEWAAFWLDRAPEQAVVYRNAEGEPVGFLHPLALDAVSVEDVQRDPAARAAWTYLEEQAPLRAGERATLFRFWLARDTYQTVSAVQSLIFVSMVRHYLTTPRLAFTFLPCADPDFWKLVFAYADLDRLPAADYHIEGRPFGMYGHDWRSRPPAAWLDLLAEREMLLQPVAKPAPRQIPLLVLSEEAFRHAVRSALRAYAQPHKLAESPLLRSHMVLEAAEGIEVEADLIEALCAMIREAAQVLAADPRQEKAHRALDRTYLHPAASQEQAAERLGLPFSTYRRHLAKGIEEVTRYLWHKEVGR